MAVKPDLAAVVILRVGPVSTRCPSVVHPAVDKTFFWHPGQMPRVKVKPDF